MAKRDNTFLDMTTKPVSHLIARLAVPTIVSMLVSSIYNMADTFFVSQLGTSQSGAVGILFTVMSLIQAIGFMLGMGSGSIVSRKIGEQNIAEAHKYATTGFCLAFVAGCLLGFTSILFLDNLIDALGATATIKPYAKEYAFFVLLGTPFMASSFVMNNLLRFQGKATLAMIGITSGGILNIILDPILIFYCNLGIRGAALATLISQMLSFALLFAQFATKKATALILPRALSRNIKIYTDIIKIGFPSLCRQGLAALASLLLNRSIKDCGMRLSMSALAIDGAVAGMAITSRVCMFVMALAIGIGQGFQPVCGINYGAKKYARVKEAFWFLVKASLVIMSASCVVCFVFSEQIVRFFRDDAVVIAIGSRALRLQSFAMPLMPLQFGINMMLQTTGNSKSAAFLSSLRQGLFYIPLLFVLANNFGIAGIQATQLISDFCCCLVTIPFGIQFFKNLDKSICPRN